MFSSVLVYLLAVAPNCPCAFAEDWPTYQHDQNRSGITSEMLSLPLYLNWVLSPRQAPRAAWGESPAKNDPWHGFSDLKPRMLFDRVNNVTVAGNRLYFGSTSDDKVCCVDVDSGSREWTYFTEGPVRFAPTVLDGKVYFGSDDGYVYCLNAEDGAFSWKYKPIAEDSLLIGNGRMISTHPIRTSVLLQNGLVFFCAGIFPEKGVYMCALNASDGSVAWRNSIGISPQGYLLGSDTRLYVPTGKTDPVVFRCSDGQQLGSYGFGRSGGTYALIVEDKIVSGPGYGGAGSDLLLAYDTNSTDCIAYVQGNHILITNTISYLHRDAELSALDRAAFFKAAKKTRQIEDRQEEIAKRLESDDPKPTEKEIEQLEAEVKTLKIAKADSLKAQKAAILWTAPCNHPYSLILAGDTLFAGGDGEVGAYDTADGALLWTGEVTGCAYGLTVAAESLFVSTDQATIHRFGAIVGVPMWMCY
jgi:outer membrane protein assembly factor BamB